MVLTSILTLIFAASRLTGTAATDSIPPRPIHQLVHTTWTPKVGDGPAGVRALAQTTDGYLWIGTFFGLTRFDGVRFVRYTPLAGDTLPPSPLGGLLATRDGSLWILADGGVVSRLRGGRVVTYGKADGLANAWQLTESSKGELIAGTIDGLRRFSGGKWENVNAAWAFPAKQARAVRFDREDALWVMTEDRVLYRPAGSPQFLDPGISIKSAPIGSMFAEERDGTMWISVMGERAHTLRKVADPASRLTRIDVAPLALMVDRKGSLWMAASGDGLLRVPDVTGNRGRRFDKVGPAAEHFTMKDGLLADIPTAILEDKEGNIWVGSANGLERFREGAFTPILGSGPARPRFVMPGRDSSVWSGAFNDLWLQRVGPDGQDLLHTGFGMLSTAQDVHGRTLIVGNDTSILRLEGKRFLPLPLRRGTARGLLSLTADPGGSVWVYSQEIGLLHLVGDSLVPVAALEDSTYHHGLPFSDSKGRIWVAQVNRVGLYANGHLTTYGAKQGIGGFVYGFFEDRAGTIWASTGDGLSKFDGERFRTLTAKQGIPGSTVYGAAQDDTGAWWLATTPGILRFPPGEIEHVLNDSTYAPHSQTFDESDGMMGALVKGYWGPVVAKSRDGKIWVTTDSGLARIDPRRLPVAEPPPVSLEVVRLQGREMAISDSARIPPTTRDLEIDYTSLTFGIPERAQFRYRLEGADGAWQEVGNRRRAYYSGLAPGRYRFQVTASYGDGIWNQTAASWGFQVLPAWYQTIWFRAGLVLLIGGLGAAAAALIQRQRHRLSQRALRGQYEATLAERTRIAQDLHDTLLQDIAGLSMQLQAAERALPDHPDVAIETLIHARQLTRTTLRQARERVLDLHEPDLGDGDVATALETNARSLIATTGISLSLETQGERRRLPRAVEITGLRIGREAIANGVKHAEARRIDVVVGFSAEALHIEVRDDGRGFTPEQGEHARQEGHLGLSGMRERAAQVGGTCQVRSRPEEGTVVIVELPVKESRSTG